MKKEDDKNFESDDDGNDEKILVDIEGDGENGETIFISKKAAEYAILIL
jgi:hypothetical protein